MPAVVSDTGPIRYLVLIGDIGLLPRLFGTVCVPELVHAELSHVRAPARLRTWVAARPPWFRVMPTASPAHLPLPHLDVGERAAIALAEATRVAFLLMDDRRGVAAALARGIDVVGTIGVLDLAARRGLVDFPAAIERLRATNFRVSPPLLDDLLARHRSPGDPGD